MANKLRRLRPCPWTCMTTMSDQTLEAVTRMLDGAVSGDNLDRSTAKLLCRELKQTRLRLKAAEALCEAWEVCDSHDHDTAHQKQVKTLMLKWKILRRGAFMKDKFKVGMAVRIGRYKRFLVKRLKSADGHNDNQAWLINEPVDNLRLWCEDDMKAWD